MDRSRNPKETSSPSLWSPPVDRVRQAKGRWDQIIKLAHFRICPGMHALGSGLCAAGPEAQVIVANLERPLVTLDEQFPYEELALCGIRPIPTGHPLVYAFALDPVREDPAELPAEARPMPIGHFAGEAAEEAHQGQAVLTAAQFWLLRKAEEAAPDRLKFADFIGWLKAKGYLAAELHELDRLLDRYFELDSKQVEEARAALARGEGSE